MQPDMSARVPEQGNGLFVFANKKATECLEHDEYVNIYGNMSQHTCPTHLERLTECPRGGAALCNNDDCTRKQAFQCVQALMPRLPGDQNPPCQYGLCKRCGRTDARGRAANDDNFEEIEQEEDYDPGDPDIERYVVYNVPEEDGGQAIHLDVGPEPLHSTNKGQFKSRRDYGCTVSGQFLLNSFLKLFVRTTTNTKPPVKWAQLFAMVKSKLPGQEYPLDQAEGLLYPTIFWHKNADGSITGALPSVVYSDHSRKQKVGNLASVTDHLKVRMMDYTLLTATSDTYRSFCFDTKVNHQMYHNSIDCLFKRGLESVIKITDSLNHPDDRSVDEIIGSPNAKRVAAMQRRGKANTFATMTCNDSATPGVKVITDAIHDYADKAHLNDPSISRDDFRHQLLQNHCNMLTVAWHRTIRYFMALILRFVNLIFP